MQTSIRQKKPRSSRAESKPFPQAGKFSGQGIPNASALAMLRGEEGPAADGLEEKLLRRLPPAVPRLQEQIPQAESEADRLSARITAGTPDAVKAQMGRRLGADFSGVRFHTGASAAAKAETMGARAYTSGADIYFDAEGFEPSVAAHMKRVIL